MIDKKQFLEFRDYVHNFYGKGGIYDLGCGIPDIENAIYLYFGKLQVIDWLDWGDGDTVDRERVRYILEEDFGFAELNPPKDRIEITI
jgi:hypothetical protein